MQRNNSEYPGKLYFRSDTREALDALESKGIFQVGFQTRNLKSKKFWKESIQFSELRIRSHDKTHIRKIKYGCDARADRCVCLSDDFRASMTFPIRPDVDDEYNETYLYAIAGPAPTDIAYPTKKLCHDYLIPKNKHEAIIDLHNFQLAYVNDRVENFYMHTKTNYDLVCNEAAVLFGREYISAQIPKENIIAAVRVKCYPRYLKKGNFRSYEREFKINDEIILNPAFNPYQKMMLLDKNNESVEASLDYTTIKNDAIQILNDARYKLMKTSTIRDGLIGESFKLNIYVDSVGRAIVSRPNKIIDVSKSRDEKKVIQLIKEEGQFKRPKPSIPLENMDTSSLKTTGLFAMKTATPLHVVEANVNENPHSLSN